MRLLGYLLLACVVLAAIRAAMAALAVILLIGLIWSAITRPRETTGLLGMAIVVSLVQNHGLACLCLLGVAIVSRTIWRIYPGAPRIDDTAVRSYLPTRDRFEDL